VSQNELPGPKPDFLVKAWFLVISATTPLGIYAALIALAMLLTCFAVVKVFGH
jgi:hypothetical protein